MSTAFEALADHHVTEGGRLEFMTNDRYADAVQELVTVARTDKRATNDPAYRLLQVLSRLRTSDGSTLPFDPPPRGPAARPPSPALDDG